MKAVIINQEQGQVMQNGIILPPTTDAAIEVALGERARKMREQELLYVEKLKTEKPKTEKPKKVNMMEDDALKAKVKAAVNDFCKRNALDPVLGKGGSYWLKAGAYRAVGIEPKRYGWVVSINNRLFDDLEDPETCQIVTPTKGEWFWSKNTLTKNMWKVRTEEELFDFLNQ